MGTRTGYAAGVSARFIAAGHRPVNDAIRDSRSLLTERKGLSAKARSTEPEIRDQPPSREASIYAKPPSLKLRRAEGYGAKSWRIGYSGAIRYFLALPRKRLRSR